MYICHKNTHISALANFVSSTIKYLRGFLVNRIVVLWNATPCVMGVGYQPSEGKCCISYVRSVFLNRRAAARYCALTSIIAGRERFYWNLSFQFSKNFSFINILYWIYFEKYNIRECVEKLRPRCWPEETTICYKISLVQ